MATGNMNEARMAPFWQYAAKARQSLPLEEMTIPPAMLIADADVLVNYHESEFGVLELIKRHIGNVAVLEPVFHETGDVTPGQCEQVGVDIVPTETAWLMQAAETSTHVSFNGYLCLLACMDKNWTCVTNDGPLRRLCIRRGVATQYSIGPVEDMVAAGALGPRRAIAIAQRMQGLHPFHANERAIARFMAELTMRAPK